MTPAEPKFAVSCGTYGSCANIRIHASSAINEGFEMTTGDTMPLMDAKATFIR